MRLGEGATLTAPAVFLQMPGLDGVAESASHDVVAIDDFILGGVGFVVPEPNPIAMLLVGGILTWITLRVRKGRITSKRVEIGRASCRERV